MPYTPHSLSVVKKTPGATAIEERSCCPLPIDTQLTDPTIATLLAVIFCALIFPSTIFNPANTKGLYLGDGTTFQLGWEFFRRTDWYFPLGLNPSYGMEMGSSIVFSDTIPLIAIPLKLLSAWLPNNFQYFGLWIGLCYALTGYFSWSLARLVTRHRVMAMVLSLFLTTSPVLLDRGHMGQYSLMGHWLILWALKNYCSPRYSISFLGHASPFIVAILVHAYLAVIVFLVYLAGTVKRNAINYTSIARMVAELFQLVMIAAVTAYLAGYFTLGPDNYPGGNYGLGAANLNTFWNPIWESPFLPSLPVRPLPAYGEGFQYLGVGGLLLSLIALFIALYSPHTTMDLLQNNIPILVVAFIITAIAISHQVWLNDSQLFELKIPESIITRMSAVRVSGRFLWFVHYGMFAGTFTILCRKKNLYLPYVGICMLLLQWVDLAPRYIATHKNFIKNYVIEAGRDLSALKDPLWDEAAKRYHRLLVVPIEHMPQRYATLAYFAAPRGLSINVGYFARVDNERISQASRLIEANTRRGEYENAIYVFSHPAAIAPMAKHDGWTGEMDGFIVFLPRWKQ